MHTYQAHTPLTHTGTSGMALCVWGGGGRHERVCGARPTNPARTLSHTGTPGVVFWGGTVCVGGPTNPARTTRTRHGVLIPVHRWRRAAWGHRGAHHLHRALEGQGGVRQRLQHALWQLHHRLSGGCGGGCRRGDPWGCRRSPRLRSPAHTHRKGTPGATRVSPGTHAPIHSHPGTCLSVGRSVDGTTANRGPCTIGGAVRQQGNKHMREGEFDVSISPSPRLTPDTQYTHELPPAPPPPMCRRQSQARDGPCLRPW
jgi:hypothetical protein